MTLDLESTRRALIAMRVKHGAKSAIGYRCSSLIEMLQNLQEAKDEDQRRFLTRCIKDMMTDLAALNAEEL